MSAAQRSDAAHRELLGPAVPEDLAGRRLLDVGPGGEPDGLSDDLAGRGAAEVVRWDPAAALEAEPGFDLVVCREVLQRDPHPANLLTAIWDATAADATLLLHSRVLAEVSKSMYAQFVAASAGLGDTEWLPGRLALRWTVETAGFDADRWISTGPTDGAREADAYLHATRTARIPSLRLATPAAPSQAGERG